MSLPFPEDAAATITGTLTLTFAPLSIVLSVDDGLGGSDTCSITMTGTQTAPAIVPAGPVTPAYTG